MDKLYQMLDQAKKEYELKKNKEEKQMEEIFESMAFKEEIILRTYQYKGYLVNLFQKRFELSKLKRKYYILHDANDSNYFSIERKISQKVIGDFVVVREMYILIPKFSKALPLCLILEHISSESIVFSSNNVERETILRCFTNLYCESVVNVYLGKYNFEEKLCCNLQSIKLSNKPNFTFKMSEENYLENIKNYIKEKYLNGTFLFKILENKEFKEFVLFSEEHNLQIFDIKRIYERYLNGETAFEALILVDGYKIIYDVTVDKEIGVVEILNPKEKVYQHFGYLKMKVDILHIKLSLYKEESLLNESVIKLRVPKTFEDNLGKYINEEFTVN